MTEPWSRLKHQCRGRELSAEEMALARALEAIYASGISDFAEVARRLTEQSVKAPTARTTEWTLALLESELSLINASLDDAYARTGLGA